jgi:hypothetical protein
MLAVFVALLSGAPIFAADEPAAAKPKPAGSGDEVQQLSAFEVRAESDSSYGAMESNSITRFRTDLQKLPVTAEVFTETFMRDIAANSPEEMLLQYGGAGMSTADAGAAGAFTTQPGDATSGAQINIRGLRATVHRDGVLPATSQANGVVGTTSPFSTQAVEMTGGAQSLLYGDATGGGTVNLVSKQARFSRESARFDYRIDQYGDKRAIFDENIGLDKIAIRVALTGNEIRYNRLNLGGPAYGAYVQFAVKLPLRSLLRISGQRTSAELNSSVNNGNVNNFLVTATGAQDTSDPRFSYALRYLVATNQLGPVSAAHPTDLRALYTPGLSLANVDSFRGWWKSDFLWDVYSNTTLETTINHWLSSQIGFAYDNANKDSPGGSSALTPGLGKFGAGANPFPGTAIQLSTPSDSQTFNRRMGFRYSLLAENEFWGGRIKSQTIASGEGGNINGGQSGVAYGYYKSDAQGHIINNGVVTNNEYGRTLLTTSPSLWYSVQEGLQAKPLFHPRTTVIQAIDTSGTAATNPDFGKMVYWARDQRRMIDKKLISATNPLGIIYPSGTGSNGAQYNVGHTETHAYTLANVTEWFGGKVETLAGVRYLIENDQNDGPTSHTVPPTTRKPIYAFGASYQLLPWARLFADAGTSFQPGPQPFDPYGKARLSPTGKGLIPDVGVKFTVGKSLSGQLTYAPKSIIKNEDIAIDATFVTAINPAGVNGQFSAAGGAPNSQINADKESTWVGLNLNYNPSRNYRLSFRAETTDGKFLTSSNFSQLYNDQFNLNNGVVTYADKTPVLVDPTGKGGAATTPLTLAMINTVGNPFYATPDPDSGSITNTVLKTALNNQDPIHGTAKTGVNGLPISAIQYTWTDPNNHQGVLNPVTAGQKTTGYYHYDFAIVNKYDFTEGRLKGFGIGSTLSAGYQFRSHYYPTYPPGQTTATKGLDQTKALYLRPTNVTADLILSYHHRFFGKYDVTTQLNVKNLLNHYQLIFPPASAGAPTYNNFIYTAAPRQWVWSNSFAF